MIPKKAEELLRDIFLQMRDPEVHSRVKEDPEAHLLSLLTVIRKEMVTADRKRTAMLYSTVEKASFEDSIEEAKEELGQPVS